MRRPVQAQGRPDGAQRRLSVWVTRWPTRRMGLHTCMRGHMRAVTVMLCRWGAPLVMVLATLPPASPWYDPAFGQDADNGRTHEGSAFTHTRPGCLCLPAAGTGMARVQSMIIHPGVA